MRVNFFRFSNAADSLDLATTTATPPKKPKSSTIRRLSGFAGQRPVLEGRAPSNHSLSSTDSNMPDTKRKSLAMAAPRASSKSRPHVPATLSIVMESPPTVLYGPVAVSTGALLSGQLKLHVADEQMVIESMTMTLTIDSKMKRPFHAHCAECAQQSTELEKWSFLHGQATWKRGDSDFPFSFLLPGHLPATMHGALSTIEYNFNAVIKTATGESVLATKELVVKRSIAALELPRQSIRIFPPTNLTAHVELPNVIHPIGEFNLKFRLDGIIKRNPDTATQTHWKLKRMTWRLDEQQKAIAPACPKHALKAGAAPGEKKGISHQEVRTLNSEELKSGWKCDYGSGADGSIEMEFPFSIRADAHPLCDMKAEDGTEVSHVLVMEMIVAEEFAPLRKPSQVTPTGAARVLRMHFNLVVTERGGLGISWDEEQPPTYADVPASPPSYARGTADHYTDAIPDYADLMPLEERPGGESSRHA